MTGEKGDARPEKQEDLTSRTKRQLQAFQDERVDNTTSRKSNPIECGPFRKFGLYVYIDSSSTPTTLQVEVEFLDRWTGHWHHYKQGPFAALFWEDGDTASGIYECFVGDVAGRAVRVTLTGVGTEAAKYFDVSIGLDFWN